MKREYLIAYLNKRKVKDEIYKDFIINETNKKVPFKLFQVDGFDYKMSHFLDDSEQEGYGLLATNETLNLSDSNYIAIGLVEGDDVICMNTLNSEIVLWLVQTGNGERVKIAESFKSFLDKCIADYQ